MPIENLTSAGLYKELTGRPFPTGLEPNEPNASEKIVAKVIREEHFSLFKLFIVVAPFLALAAYGIHVGGLDGQIMSYVGAGAGLASGAGMVAWQTYEFSRTPLTHKKLRTIINSIHDALVKTNASKLDPIFKRIIEAKETDPKTPPLLAHTHGKQPLLPNDFIPQQ